MNIHENETQVSENGMLKLAGELRELTSGLCRVGPGPFGFGVCNCTLSRLGCVLCLDPDPYGEMPLPDKVDEYRVTVQPINNDRDSSCACAPVGMERVEELARCDDPATRLVAQALLKLCGTTVVISEQENSEAFDSMADLELKQENGLTDEEASRLCGLRWYEAKTPQEITSFQLFEKQLCMPLEEFKTAVEAALGRSVGPDELQFSKQDLQAEYRAVLQSEGSQSVMEQQDPGDGLSSLTM